MYIEIEKLISLAVTLFIILCIYLYYNNLEKKIKKYYDDQIYVYQSATKLVESDLLTKNDECRIDVILHGMKIGTHAPATYKMEMEFMMMRYGLD